ncbi:MAG: transporter substrate-binding domain-containing protein [Bacteroidota bacterium]
MMILAYTRNKIIISLFILIGAISVYLTLFYENDIQEPNYIVPSSTFDLDEIKKRGKIVALTDNRSTSFYIYRGDSMGYEYELLSAFAKEIGVKLEIRITRNKDSIFDQLTKEGVDIIAANLAVTNERLQIVDFTEPFMQVPQVLVQRKPNGWENMTRDEMNDKLIRNPIDLSGKNICVRKGSSFYARLQNLSEEIGEQINIIQVPGEYDTEQLIAKVANGEIDYTIADENVALNNQAYYSNIDVETAISFPQKIAWAIRKSSPGLTKELNNWIEKIKTNNTNTLVLNKYFKPRKKKASIYETKYLAYAGGTISAYDDLIKTYSQKIDWDWKLLASMICQESRFSPTARSWAGANGLMQLMPGTAKRYGLDTIDATAEQSLIAGTSYILDLDKYWRNHIPNKQERIKFVLASYNAGLGHIIDARNLAIKYNKEPNIWHSNVEDMLLQKSNPTIYNDPIVKCGYCRGQEPYLYVKEILHRYQYYKKARSANESLVSN